MKKLLLGLGSMTVLVVPVVTVVACGSSDTTTAYDRIVWQMKDKLTTNNGLRTITATSNEINADTQATNLTSMAKDYIARTTTLASDAEAEFTRLGNEMTLTLKGTWEIEQINALLDDLSNKL